MPIEILMPALSPTMKEGNLVKWNKEEGEEVAIGDVIAEIETDKATMEVEAVDDGVLAKILVAGGTENVAVNALIALMLEEDEDASALEDYEASSTSTSTSPATAETPSAPEEDTKPAPSSKTSNSDERVFATPLAKRIAADKGLDLKSVQGSGPHGRIVKADVESAQTSSVQPTSSTATPSGPSSFKDEPLNNMRKVIARRLQESKQKVPHFYLSVDCQIDALLKLRKELNTAQEDQKISVNDMVIKAVAMALKDVPEANASYMGDTVRLYDSADISVAVAIEGGLITPIVFGAEHRGLTNISATMKDLAGRAREGKLKPEEFQGGSFSISNLGMYGIKQFNAIINPPQACILAVGAGVQQPVVKDGSLVPATVMNCTLSVDHRVVDGAVGAEFMNAFKKRIENPLLLLI